MKQGKRRLFRGTGARRGGMGQLHLSPGSVWALGKERISRSAPAGCFPIERTRRFRRAQLAKGGLSDSERKGKELREKPIRGFSRFQSEVFWNFLKVQKTCSGWRKDIFDSLTIITGTAGGYYFSALAILFPRGYNLKC